MIPSKNFPFSGSLSCVFAALAAVFLSAIPAAAEQVIFTEVHYNPKTGDPEFIEILNNTSTPFDTGKWYFSDGIEYTFPDFDPGDTDAHILRPFERILVSDVDEATLRAAYSIPAETRILGPYTGALNNGGETLTLNDKNGVVMTSLDYRDSGKWPAAPDGTGHTLVRINPNLTDGEWRNWTSSTSPNGTPGAPRPDEGDQPTVTTRVAETTAVWRYDQEGNDLGTAWRESGFDDSLWPEGAGAFGRDSADRGIQTDWATGNVTYYLRKEIEWGTPFDSATLDVSGLVDDGAVVYLNGQEVGRFSMPAGAVDFQTTANNHEANSVEDIVSGSDISGLLQVGTNVLAVEVHNVTSGSSDIVFGADFDITTTAPVGGVSAPISISEVHFDGEGRVDWVELYTPGSASVSANTLAISSLADLSDATVLSGTIPGGGYMSFDVDFPVDANGNINLYVAQGATVLAAQKLDRDLGEESFQSVPVGKEFFGGAGHTRDAANDPTARQTDIVINEIMYDAPSDHVNAEYIELFNRGDSAIDLSGWSFTSGISFTFPTGTMIGSGEYVVVAADVACMNSSYGGGFTVVGNWDGRLSDGGELIRLEDANQNLADEVDYLPAGDWPNMADGDGASMELRHPDMDNNVGTAWADSNESNKSTMQTFTYTQTYDRAWQQAGGGQELHAHLVGDSHVIIENVSLKRNNTGSNLINNPTVMSPDNLSSKGWVCQGTHWASFMDNGSLNLIADGHGDNKANRAEVDTQSLTFDDSYTLTFDARWVSGKPRVIMQTIDHGFGTSFLLPIPANLGTPGADNSSAFGRAAPTISGVIHSPAVPAPGTPVKVSARVDSSAILTAVDVVHRLDTNTGDGAWNRTAMTDNGTGLYSATISQYNTQGNIVEFYVEAKSGSLSNFQPRFGPDLPAMWIVDSRTMPDVLMQERFIVSEHDRAALNTNTGHSPTFAYNFPRMSNHFFPCTFIANESEIYYNAEIRKSGSPFTRSTNANIDHGKWKLPGDRLFRGRRRSVIDASGTGEGSGTPRFYDDRIARYFMYQLGHPINEMEYVHSVVNTLPFKLRENHEPISNDMLNRNFENGSDGTLMRIDDEWHFNSDDGDSRNSRNADWSYKGSDNPVRYHSEWILRTRESDYDYSNFIEWVRTLDENSFDEETIRRMANVEMLCLNAAVRGYDADWDTITVNRGKNAYFYRPQGEGQFGKGWMLMHWDGDRVFERTNQAIIGGRTGVPTFFNKPYVKRVLNYYLTKLLDEHTKDSARTLAWMDAEIDAVAGSGINMPKSHYLNWFTNRETLARNFVTSAVNNTNFVITTSNSATANDTLNLAGTAPPGVFRVHVVGQEGAMSTWVNTTTWSLAGIHLQSGINVLDVQGIDHEGNIVETAQFTITKTTDAPPVVNVATAPKSRNVSLGEVLVLDASASFDPEGGALTFGWAVTPSEGVGLAPSGATASASFSQPGIYQFTVTATDDQAQDTVQQIDIAVYGPGSFSTFGTETLSDIWSFLNAEKHGNSSSGPHFSLQDNPGRLTLHVPYGSKTPLGLPQPELPTPVEYLSFGDTYTYDDSGADHTTGAVFAQPGFDDSAWEVGPGFFKFGNYSTAPPAPGFQTDLTRSSIISYYFRTEFEFDKDPVGAQISIDHIADDGVRYYLNGQVLGNVRLADGAITFETPATPLSSEGPVEEGVLTVDGSAFLVNGTNVFAAEVHNQGTGSSDLAWGARVNIAANDIGNGEIDLDDVLHPWVYRDVPTTEDWTLQTEVKLEKAQIGEFFAGLLVQADQGGVDFRYGIGFADGDTVSALRVNPSGTSEILTSIPAITSDIITVRLQRSGDQLLFSWHDGEGFTQIHSITLTAGTTFSRGGVFATTETDEQSVEASFDYLMLVDSTPASAVPLVVSEVMYNPAGATALEFLEVYNAGATPLDLEGYGVVQDEPFDSFTFPAYTLQPGAYALLVEDMGLFTAAYPGVPAAQIIGEWQGGAMSNGGDTITITDGTGALVTSFTYDDKTPWPEAADGDGPSMVINDENGDLEPGDGANWHASAASGGSPGSGETAAEDFTAWMASNGFADPNAEYADSGLSNLMAYALGRDLRPDVSPTIDASSGSYVFQHRRRIGDDSLIYSLESSTDLSAWIPAVGFSQDGAPGQNGDGTETVTLVGPIPAPVPMRIHFRLRVELPPE